MYGLILFLWVVCLTYYNPQLIGLIDFSDPLLATASVVFFIFCLNIFWFYGIYHVVIVSFAALAKRTLNNHTHVEITGGPAVAILYTTMNDFCERAVLSCINQDYANYHLFVLDDSTEETIKKKIDDFCARHSQRCTVIRRDHRRGFKAGNLNNALANYISDYPYFAIVDADEVVPSNFISGLLPHFNSDSNIGFVQARHSANPDQPTKFARDLSETVDMFWQHYLPARHRFGFLIFYGHGAVIRRDVWERVGGFPEVVSEDLAFSCKAAEAGFRGHYAYEVVCFEDVPASYTQFKNRYNKWIRGAMEFLWKGYGSFLRSRVVSPIDKIDVFSSCLSLCLPLFFVPFLLVANVVIPFYFLDPGQSYEFILPIIGKVVHLWPLSSLHPKFGITWRWDFYLITLLGMFAPMVGLAFHLLPRHPWRFLRYFTRSAAVHISIMISSVAEAIRYIVTRKTEFFVTGNISKKIGTSFLRKTVVIEFILSFALAGASLLTLNAGLLAISIAFALSPLIYKLGWEHRLVRTMVFIPMYFIVTMLMVVGFSVFGPQGMLLAEYNTSNPPYACIDPYAQNCVRKNPTAPQYTCVDSSGGPVLCQPPLLPPLPPPVYF